MALLDPFDPRIYGGLLANAANALSFPQPTPSAGFGPPPAQMQTPTGPTYARSNEGAMGGVKFPIMGAPEPQTTTMSAQSRQPEQDYGSPFQESPLRKFFDLFSIGGPTSTKAQYETMNATYQALRQAGLPDAAARASALNPRILSLYTSQIGQKTSDVKDYEYARSQGYKGTFQDWIAGKRAGAGEYGLQGIPLIGPDGQPALGQLGKSGVGTISQFPNGYAVSKKPIEIDAGTETILLDPITRQRIGAIPKNKREAAQQESLGRAQGAVRATLPTDIYTAQQTIQQIDQLLKNTGLDSIVGPVDQFRQSWNLGAAGRDALARFNQLKGKSFLSAYATLKGGGQITEVEGKKAEDAMARMDRAQSEDDFKQALRDFRTAVSDGIEKLREKAGLPASQVDQRPAGSSSPTQTLPDPLGIR